MPVSAGAYCEAKGVGKAGVMLPALRPRMSMTIAKQEGCEGKENIPGQHECDSG